MKRSTAVLLIIIAGLAGIAYAYERSVSSANSLSLTGYVVYESPSTTAYDFMILSATSTPISGVLPTMEGFPAPDDAGYRYVSYAGYGGTLPNIGDEVSVTGGFDKNVVTNPPYAFADTAKGFKVILDAQFNSTVQGMIDTYKMGLGQ